MRILPSTILLFALATVSLSAHADEGLETRLVPLIKNHRGKVALAVKHLGSGESYNFHGDEPMPFELKSTLCATIVFSSCASAWGDA